MPLTRFNKVVGLFLVGGAALVLLVAIWWGTLSPWVKRGAENATIFTGVLSSLLLLAAAGAVGVAVDGLADVSIRRAIKKAARTAAGAKFFGQGDLFTSVYCWRKWFESLTVSHPFFSHAGSDQTRHEVGSFQLAAGIFQQHSGVDQFEWVTSHYSTYHVATNFCLILAASAFVPVKLAIIGILGPWTAVSFSVLALIGAATSSILAVDRYLYTYVATFRFAGLWLHEKSHVELKGGQEIGSSSEL